MKTICLILSISLLSSCSTAGGWYKEYDPVHGELSPVRSIFCVVGVLGLLAGVGYGGYSAASQANYKNNYLSPYKPASNFGHAWDFQPHAGTSGAWVCRDKSNGQYANFTSCNGLPYIDNWM